MFHAFLPISNSFVLNYYSIRIGCSVSSSRKDINQYTAYRRTEALISVIHQSNDSIQIGVI